VPVDDYPLDESPYGVRGMAGNARDLCLNVWTHEGPPLDGESVVVAADEDEHQAMRAARGGAWTTLPQNCRVAGRFAVGPGERFGGWGFRLARSLVPQRVAEAPIR